MDLPVYGLDEVVWRSGWRKAPQDERAAAEAALVARPRWIIEGVSWRVLDAADTVVFLDVSRRTALMRCAWRNWPYLFRSRPELPPNCPEIRIIPKLILLIWRFPRLIRPTILMSMPAKGENAHHVRSTADLRAVISALAPYNA